MTIRRARRRARRSDTLAVSVALGGALLLAWPSVGQTPPASEPAPKSLLPDSFGPATPPPTAAPLPLPSGDTPETSDPSGALPTAPDGTPADAAAAQPDPFDLPSATGRTVDVAGPLTTAIGGYGIGAFGGSNARFVSGLMRRMDTPLASRWAHIVLRRALLSKSAAPAGVNPADWIAARAGLLLRLGEIDGAKALVDFVPTDRFTPLLYRIAGQVQFAAADPAGMCPIAATGVSVSPDPLWRLSEAMCAALTGDDVSAARGFDALHEKGDVDAFDLRLGERVAALAGTGGRAANINWDEVDGLTPYRFGITAAAGVAVPPALLTSFAVSSHGASYGWVMRASGLPPEVRAAALRPAAALGIAGVGEMVALRSADAASDRGPAADLRRAYVAASTADRIAAMRSIWASGATEAERYGAHVETALAAARVAPASSFAADAPELIGSMLSAGLTAEAARWARIADGGSAGERGQAWALLAAGGAVEITPKRFTDWLGAASDTDRTAARHRAALLLTALDALGRTHGDSGWDGIRKDLGLALVTNSWTRAIDAAATAGRPGEVAVLAGTGLQSAWSAVPAAHFAHIIAAYARVGRTAEAQLLAAEAVMRG